MRFPRPTRRCRSSAMVASRCRHPGHEGASIPLFYAAESRTAAQGGRSSWAVTGVERPYCLHWQRLHCLDWFFEGEETAGQVEGKGSEILPFGKVVDEGTYSSLD